MGDAQIKEASTTSQLVVGFSAYLHGIGYSVEKFQQELNTTVAYIKSQSEQK